MTTQPTQNETSKLLQKFLRTLKCAKNNQQQGYAGIIATDYATRLVHATDNSVYQLVPQAVLFPKSESDVSLILSLAAQEEFQSVHFVPRGGGTGTNGQSLNTGIVIDLSRFMNAILGIDYSQQQARVQPGVILDQLQDVINPDGYFFAPELSPSNRATLGGMANTDACGKGSRLYGRTGDHVIAMRVVLASGEVLHLQRLNEDELSRVRQLQTREGRLYDAVADACAAVPEHPGAEKLGRFITAYNMWKAFDKTDNRFSLNPVICGSEGSLAVITELTLNITPNPACKALFAIRYSSFDSALSAARELLSHQPSAIETVDDKILMLAKNDIIFPKVRPYLGEDDNFAGNAVNLVEFVGQSIEEFFEKVAGLKAALDAAVVRDGVVISYHYTEEKTAQNALWDLRKKGVGLLGNTQGKRRPIPFVEDTAVPPEYLADYIREFRALLDQHGLTYGMFGHVDVGCLHVRPALNLRDGVDEQLFKTISDQVYALVNKYGGVMWSEHGKGFRSAYGPDFHGADIYQRMQKIKTAFDPHNQLNPGKICTPLSCDQTLINPFDNMRAMRDKWISVEAETQVPGAIYCNGNGQCFDYRMDSVMCPSYKASGDRIHSPKGRSGLMREWLTQRDHEQMALTPATVPPLSLGARLRRELNRFTHNKQVLDHQVKQAMDGCLSCKACATQCPIKVDVPTQKALFLFHYHRQYPRRIRDYLMGSMERWGVYAAKLPGISNVVLLNPISRWISKILLGLTHMPYFSETSLDSILFRHPHWRYDATKVNAMTVDKKAKTVFLMQDTFTSFFDTDVVLSTALVLEKIGFDVVLLPYIESGKALHVKGRLHEFEACAKNSVQRLQTLLPVDATVVCIEPAVALIWRQEYKALSLSEWPEVKLVQEFLSEQLIARKNLKSKPVYHFSHCTEKTQATSAAEQWRQVYERFGLECKLVNTGCCGMAGSFGHEVENDNVSTELFNQSWRDPISFNKSNAWISISGFSCRSQTERFIGNAGLHPMQILHRILEL